VRGAEKLKGDKSEEVTDQDLGVDTPEDGGKKRERIPVTSIWRGQPKGAGNYGEKGKQQQKKSVRQLNFTGEVSISKLKGRWETKEWITRCLCFWGETSKKKTK